MRLRHCKRNLYIKILSKVYACSYINYMLITEEFGIGLYLHFLPWLMSLVAKERTWLRIF